VLRSVGTFVGLVLSLTLTFIPPQLVATSNKIVSAQAGIASDGGLLLAVLRIRDVFPGSEFSPSLIPDPHLSVLTQKIVSKL
jgi:hypothetical protein